MVGCGGSSASGPTIPPQIASAVDTFADAYAHAWCDGLAACCHFWPFHQDVCLAKARQSEEYVVAATVMWSSTLPHLDTTARDNCLAEIAAIVGSCPATTFPALQAPACNYVFTPGTSPPGGTCSGPLDCASPPGQVPTCVSSVCEMPITNLPAGTTCIDSAQCATGLACDPGTYTCGPKLAVGALCADGDCADGTYCSPIYNVCTADAPLGAACYGILEACGPDAYCNPDTLLCQAFGVTGSACTNSGECVAGDYCQTDLCTTSIPIGGACPTGAGPLPCADQGLCSHTSGAQSLPGDTSPMVCIPTNLPDLCYTGS